MIQLNRLWTILVDYVRTSTNIGPILLAFAIGTGAGFAAIGFRRLISFSQWLFFDALGAAIEPGLSIAYTIPVLALGGLLVGLITRYFAPETKGHGVPEVMLAVAQEGGRIRPRVTLFKALAAAVCIGSGGSAGREGPIVQIGSAFGSTMGQLFRLPDRRVTLSVACGAAGAIAATFNAPIAGVMFSLEVILRRFTSNSFGMVVLSSTAATIVSRTLSVEGDEPAFAVLERHGLTSVREVFLFALLGILCAGVAYVYTRSLYLVEDFSDRVKLPEYIKPAIGGALVGAIGIWTPEVFGTGYETIEGILNGDVLWRTMLVLCIAKIVATSLTIGSGGSGGVFAPALFIGAAFGGAFGHAANAFFPDHLVSEPGAFALVAMAAVFGAAAHAPITAFLILFEMTDDYRIIVPLMAATVLSTFASQALLPDSIYTLKLRRRGIAIGNVPEVNLMDAITVADAMEREYATVDPEMTLTELADRMPGDRRNGYPVINGDGKLVGIITMSDIESALIERSPDTTVGDVCTKNVVVCRPEHTLGMALTQLGARDVSCIPVIDPEKPDNVVGMLYRASVIRAYTKMHRDVSTAAKRVDELRAANERHEMIIERELITSNGALAGTLVKDAGFPAGSTLSLIQRGNETIVPRGSTRLEAGDVIVVVSNKKYGKSVRSWLRANR